MPSYNHVCLMGNVTRDIELRHISSGTAVCDMDIAVNDRVKKGNEWVDETTYVTCTLWGRTAEVAAEYLSKGSPVLVDGRLKMESWLAHNGENRTKHKVVVDKLQLLGGNKSGGSKPAKSKPPADDYDDYEPNEMNAQDLPF